MRSHIFNGAINLDGVNTSALEFSSFASCDVFCSSKGYQVDRNRGEVSHSVNPQRFCELFINGVMGILLSIIPYPPLVVALSGLLSMYWREDAL